MKKYNIADKATQEYNMSKVFLLICYSSLKITNNFLDQMCSTCIMQCEVLWPKKWIPNVACDINFVAMDGKLINYLGKTNLQKQKTSKMKLRKIGIKAATKVLIQKKGLHHLLRRTTITNHCLEI